MRGLKVLLCEQDDLGSKTSANSSKLIHGGLRYLENYEFQLVRKSLQEQKLLLNLAANIIKPIPFVLPVTQVRPSWLLKVGLFFYDNLIKKSKQIPKSKHITQAKNPEYFTNLNLDIQKAYLYYDCLTNDSRLTILNALQAQNHNATILTNSKIVKAKRGKLDWDITILNQKNQQIQINCKAIINAAGPWVGNVAQDLKVKVNSKYKLVRGSHILVKKLYPGHHSYILQNTDGRIVFAIPYQGNTMLGTTEHAVKSANTSIQMNDFERDYLLKVANHYFESKLQAQDILHTWSGLRCLIDDEMHVNRKISRDYTLEISKDLAPCITIFGGKLTIYRVIAKDIIDKILYLFPNAGACKTATAFLPGAKFSNMLIHEYREYAAKKYTWLDSEILIHLLDTYGTLAENILKDCQEKSDLGRKFTKHLYQREVDYLLRHEWATNVDDILWRRAQHGLHILKDEKQALANYLLQHNLG